LRLRSTDGTFPLHCSKLCVYLIPSNGRSSGTAQVNGVH
jgi:hypothetical protein